MRYCLWPRCGERVKHGYCTKHEKSRKKLPGRRIDNRTAHQRGYDITWQRFRWDYMRHHHDCEWCGEPAQELHHKVPLKDGGEPYDVNNVVALCRVCHRLVHERLERESKIA